MTRKPSRDLLGPIEFVVSLTVAVFVVCLVLFGTVPRRGSAT